MAPKAATQANALNPIELRLGGGMLALNRLIMTFQNKRMPVAGLTVERDGGGMRITLVLECPPETARRYTTLLSSLEDVEEVEAAESPAPRAWDERRGTPEIDYGGRRFGSVENSETGEAGPETVFSYRQDGDLVWATYSGGDVRFGTLVARADGEGQLDVRYGHLNTSGELMTGECVSTPEALPDGRLRLHEEWRWTSGDRSSGHSVVEEIPGDPRERRD